MSETPNGLRGDMAAACFDPGAYVGPRGARTTDQWRADACNAGPLAPILAQVSALQAEVERLRDDRHKLSVALTSLTPGGSEFFTRRGEDFIADADACVAVVQERRRSHQDAMMRAMRTATEAQERLQKVEGEREKGRVPDGTGLSPDGEADKSSSSQATSIPRATALRECQRAELVSLADYLRDEGHTIDAENIMAALAAAEARP